MRSRWWSGEWKARLRYPSQGCRIVVFLDQSQVDDIMRFKTLVDFIILSPDFEILILRALSFAMLKQRLRPKNSPPL